MCDSSFVVGSGSPSAGGQMRFEALLAICAKLSEPLSVEVLLDELLRQARQMVSAEAGTVFVVDDLRLRFVCCQNDTRPDLCVSPRPFDDQTRKGLKGETIVIDDSSLAGFAAANRGSLKIDDAYHLPADVPYRFDRRYDESTGYRTKSLLVIPMVDRSEKVVGVLQLINRKPDGQDRSAFSEADRKIGVGLASMAAISIRNAQLRIELDRSYLDTIMRLSTAAEFRDDDTGQHIRRVSMYCETVAAAMGESNEFKRLMLFASPMHDIGKLAVPDAILKKPGPLSADERAIMEEHTVCGARILHGSNHDVLRVAERIARSHHERWDGAGYPDRLAGECIPIEGRITAVADVFDALSSKRVYKPAFDCDKAFGIIGEGSGGHFDPAVVESFLSARADIEAIHDAYQNE